MKSSSNWLARGFDCSTVRFAAVAAIFAPFLSPTTLIAIWSPGRLLIGADSAVITSMPNVVGSGCKISQDGSTFFAFSGLVEDKSVGYNVAALARQASEAPGALEQRMEQFVNLVNDPLARAVTTLKNDSPDQYAYLQQNHPALQAIFAEQEPGAPQLGVVAFAVGPDGILSHYTRMVANGDDGRGPRIIYAGKQDQIRSYLNVHHDWFLGDQAGLIRSLIQSEAETSRGEVGGPIDILSVEPNNSYWVQKKSTCP
ncbi:MAG TPA: hypothetical protein VKU01_35285 [Bryobacteraceae bacterium]|nr:hypothetical protein [Bryobacteraceae bacterium]